MKKFARLIYMTAAVITVMVQPVVADQKNGFDLSESLIPVDQIYLGGPPRDGIPSISDPKFEDPGEASLWRADDLMLT